MKQNYQFKWLLIFILVTTMLTTIFHTKLYAQNKFKSQQVSLVIAGTSTMHDWEEKANNVIVNSDFLIENGSIKTLNSGFLTVEVKSIKSKEGSMMDNRTYSALQAEKFPNITFQISKVLETQNVNDYTIIDVLGNLTIAGKTQSTELQLKCKMNNGSINITTTKKIKMTDYGIKPPSFMLGALKLGNEVILTIALTLVNA
jgi:hypothetical protein